MNEDFRDLLRELIAADARFMVVGHLVENKRATGRTKDLANLEELGERPLE